MQSLSEFLAEKLKSASSRDLAELTGLTHTSIQRMARTPLRNMPSIDTFRRLAKGFNLPLWRVLYMAGVNLELPRQFLEQQGVMDTASKERPSWTSH